MYNIYTADSQSMIFITLFLLILSLIAVSGLAWQFALLQKKYRKDTQRLDQLTNKSQLLSHLFTTALASNDTDPRTTILQIITTLHEQTDWRAHSLFSLDESSQTLHMEMAIGLSDWYIETLKSKVNVKVGDACIGRAASTRRPAVINDCFSDPRFTTTIPFAIEGKYKSLMAVPLIGKASKVYGSFCTYSKTTMAFNIDNIQFLAAVADIIATVIERAILIKNLPKEKQQQVLLTFKERW